VRRVFGCRPEGGRVAGGGWRLEAGGWRLEAGGWRLEAGGTMMQECVEAAFPRERVPTGRRRSHAGHLVAAEDPMAVTDEGRA
jgi:hypothetical protein